MTAGNAFRVVAVVGSATVPEWVAWILRRIDSTPSWRLAFEVAPSPRDGCSPRPPLALRLYDRLDALVFGGSEALRLTDLGLLCRGSASSADVGPVDVVISFLPGGAAAGGSGPPPRRGVGRLVPVEDRRPGAVPARFWQVALGDVGGSISIVATSADGGRRVIATTSAPAADRLSIARTRDAGAWASARLVLHTLELAQRGAAPPLMPQDRPAGETEPPATVAVLRHAARIALGGLSAKARKAWMREEWFVAVRARTAEGHVRGPLRRIPNPPGRYLADPFPFEHGGRHYLFVEDYSVKNAQGVISVLEPAPHGFWSHPRPVMRRDHHLSYPFVFEHDGVTYMIPETGEAGRVELHRGVDFPDTWVLERVLLDGLTAVDATVHADDGLLWLFVNVVDGPAHRGDLCVYWSPSLEGPWRPHPANPVVSDPRSARPAGRLFRHGTALIRPSQDCSRRYGEAVVLNQVEVLSKTDYRERPVGRIDPDWMPGLVGTHTYTFDSRYEFLDGIAPARRLRGPALRWTLS